jgi:hypothetical protein
MKGIYWVLFIWFAPFIALMTLWVKLFFGFCALLIKLFVWVGKMILKGVGLLIENLQKKFNEYKMKQRVNRDIAVL